MARYMCTNCGTFIFKSAVSDSYLCRECEKLIEGAELEEKYNYLDVHVK